MISGYPRQSKFMAKFSICGQIFGPAIHLVLLLMINSLASFQENYNCSEHLLLFLIISAVRCQFEL